MPPVSRPLVMLESSGTPLKSISATFALWLASQ